MTARAAFLFARALPPIARKARILTLILLGALGVCAGGCAGGRYDQDQSQSCHFLCQEVPPRARVLQSFGGGAAHGADAGTVPGNPSTNAWLSPHRVRVIIWNVHKGRDADWWSELERLSADADLVLLQEVVLSNELRTRLEASPVLGAWWGTFATQFLMEGGVPTGVLTLARQHPRYETFARTDVLEPFVKSPKLSVLSLYGSFNAAPDGSRSVAPDGEESLAVANIHGLNFRREGGLVAQVQDVARRLSDGASPFGSAAQSGSVGEAQVPAATAPAIFAGDFNAKDSSRLRAVESALAPYGFRRLELRGVSPMGSRDQVFTRGLARAEGEFIAGVSSSDHAPMRVDLFF